MCFDICDQHDPVVREESDGVDCSGTVKTPGSYWLIVIPVQSCNLVAIGRRTARLGCLVLALRRRLGEAAVLTIPAEVRRQLEEATVTV